MRALITGMGGFVALHLAKELKANGHEPWGTDVHGGSREELASHNILRADLRKRDELQAVFDVAQPEVVFHLGAQSSPRRSWDAPKETLDINVTGTRLVVECAAKLEKPARVVIASSSDVYGRPGTEAMPLKEDQPANPQSPYGVSKMAAEHLARVYGEKLGVEVVVVRPFTQVGPGQLMHFAAPNFAHEIARIEAGKGDVLRHGALEPQRDFTDVRDTVKAYRLLGEKAGLTGVFNLASGTSRPIGDVLEMLKGMASTEIRCEVDESKMREESAAPFCGDAAKLREATGWKPEIGLEQSVGDLLEEHREYFRLQAEEEKAAE